MEHREKIIISGILGFFSGFLITLLVSPYSGREFQKKIGLRKKTIEEKIRDVRRKIEQLEERIKTKEEVEEGA